MIMFGKHPVRPINAIMINALEQEQAKLDRKLIRDGEPVYDEKAHTELIESVDFIAGGLDKLDVSILKGKLAAYSKQRTAWLAFQTDFDKHDKLSVMRCEIEQIKDEISRLKIWSRADR